MSIPDFQSIMLPLLTAISDGVEHDLKEVKTKLISHFSISEDELRIKIPSGRSFLFDNRLGWAKTYLKKAGLISSARRGYLQITELGSDFQKHHIKGIKVSDLNKIKQFKDFHQVKGKEDIEIDIPEMEIRSPEEVIDSAFEVIKNDLRSELISTIKSCSPLFFEKMVIDLLIKMGYGGSRREAGTAIGKSGDGGIDGIINEDKLGLDSIYIQAKRWENTVPIKEIRDFAGSLLSKKARKGVFIITSEFPKSAYDFVNSIEPRIILIDGNKMASLMIEHNVGVSTKEVYEIKNIDHDYFDE